MELRILNSNRKLLDIYVTLKILTFLNHVKFIGISWFILTQGEEKVAVFIHIIIYYSLRIFFSIKYYGLHISKEATLLPHVIEVFLRFPVKFHLKEQHGNAKSRQYDNAKRLSSIVNILNCSASRLPMTLMSYGTPFRIVLDRYYIIFKANHFHFSRYYRLSVNYANLLIKM